MANSIFKVTSHRHSVYLFPLAHLCLCLVSIPGYVIPNLHYWGILWTFITNADLPISIVAAVLAFNGNPTLGVVWIFVAGTLWWYVLGCAVEFVINKAIRRQPTTQLIK
ncbi:MAG: hypothetical protein WBY69_02980 [Candidatus Acidiferrales bacterium]